MAGKNGARRLWHAGGAALLRRSPFGRNNYKQRQQQGEATALAAKQSAARRGLRAVIGAVLVRDAVSAACSELDPSAEVHEPSPASPPGYVQFSCSSTPSGDGGFHLLDPKRRRRRRDESAFHDVGGRAQQQVDRLADEFIWRFYDHLHAEAVAAAIAGRSSC